MDSLGAFKLPACVSCCSLSGTTDAASRTSTLNGMLSMYPNELTLYTSTVPCSSPAYRMSLAMWNVVYFAFLFTNELMYFPYS